MGRAGGQIIFQPGAEAVLLIDNDEARRGQVEIAGQGLRADDDADLARRQPVANRTRLRTVDEAGQVRHLDAGVLEPAAEGVEMLSREHGRRRGDQHLQSIEGDDRGRPKGDLRLAEADVAADEPVHGATRRQVVEHCGDGGVLVRRFREGETGGEAGVGRFRRRKRRRPEAQTRPRLFDQGGGDGVDLGAEGGAALGPARSAQPVERDGGGFGAIAPDLVELVDGGQGDGVVTIPQADALLGAGVRLDGLQPLQHAQPVVFMDHHVAGPKLGLREKIRPRAARAGDAAADDVRGRQQAQVQRRIVETAAEIGEDGHHGAGGGGPDVRETRHPGRRLAQRPGQGPRHLAELVIQPGDSDPSPLVPARAQPVAQGGAGMTLPRETGGGRSG